MGDACIKLMEMVGDTEQSEIFKTEAIKQLIIFKWDNYAKQVHYVGAFFHLVFIVIFCIYVNEIYLEGHLENKNYILCIMLICHIYTTIYDFTQLYK